MPKYQYARIALDEGEQWPDFNLPETLGVELPDWAVYEVGGHMSAGYGKRILIIKTEGSVVQPAIDAAMQIADQLGLNATLVLSDTHFNALMKASRNTNIYMPASYRAKAEHLAEKLELHDNRGNPSISALFRHLIDQEYARRNDFTEEDTDPYIEFDEEYGFWFIWPEGFENGHKCPRLPLRDWLEDQEMK